MQDENDPVYRIGFNNGFNKGRGYSRQTIDRQHVELTKRAAIIAEKVLGWKQYHISSNSEQMAYGPSEHAVKTLILLGDNLTKLVDDAIAAMSDPTK